MADKLAAANVGQSPSNNPSPLFSNDASQTMSVADRQRLTDTNQMLTLTLPGLERARRLGERPLSSQRPVTQDHATHIVSKAYAEPTSRFISRPMVSASLLHEQTPTRLPNVPVNNHRNNVVYDAQQSGEASTFHGGGLPTDPIDLEDDRLHLESSDQDVTPQGHSIISASQAPDALQPRAAAPLDADQERRTNSHRQRGNPPTTPSTMFLKPREYPNDI